MSHCHTILKELRQRGYRITPQREMVVNVIAHSEHHMSAEEIHRELGKQTQATNLATVYRTLDMLCEEGFACRNDLGEGRIAYATFMHGPHIHLICRNCNQVTEADPEFLNPLRKELKSNYHFDANLEHISIFGVCSKCRSTKI
jgi:Fur family ferric uptake transcriptional regulator